MCWCLRVYGTVLHNLLIRFYHYLVGTFYNNNCHIYCSCCCRCCTWLRHYCNCCRHYCSCCCCCCYGGGAAAAAGGGGGGGGGGCCYQRNDSINENPNANANKQTNANDDGDGDDDDDDERVKRHAFKYQHDYVIVDEADANYIEIEQRKIETESYYRTIDRATAEQLLAGREDGACLVRPFKETDISIKYIVSIWAQQQFYHLFIRQIEQRERYAIGQAKPNERYFQSPCEIIEFHCSQPLPCTNKQTRQCIVLKPIVV